MRVLLPFFDPFDKPINHPVISGGTEMFCKSIYENFTTKVVQVPYASSQYSKKEKDLVVKNILQAAEDFDADIIISNFAQAIFCGAEIIKSKVPIMIVEHCVYGMASCISRWNNAVDAGHSVYFVSEWQEKKYARKAERTGQRVVPISGYVNPSYCKQLPTLKDIRFDCGTIGRCESGKNPFSLKRLTKDSKLSTLVITSKMPQPSTEPYWKRNQHWDNVLWDIPHDEVINNIAQCRSYFSTWTGETWGITALEALSCGVPVILNGDKNGGHASQIIPAHESHYKTIATGNKDELVDAIKSFGNVDRKEIQEMTWEKHSLDAWKLQMQNAMQKTIDKFNKPRGLSVFMS